MKLKFKEMDFPGLLGTKISYKTYNEYCLEINIIVDSLNENKTKNVTISEKLKPFIIPYPFCMASYVNDARKVSFIDKCSTRACIRRKNVSLITVQSDEDDPQPKDLKTPFLCQLVADVDINTNEEILSEYVSLYWE